MIEIHANLNSEKKKKKEISDILNICKLNLYQI